VTVNTRADDGDEQRAVPHLAAVGGEGCDQRLRVRRFELAAAAFSEFLEGDRGQSANASLARSRSSIGCLTPLISW
jgi:hypothetical protein